MNNWSIGRAGQINDEWVRGSHLQILTDWGQNDWTDGGTGESESRRRRFKIIRRQMWGWMHCPTIRVNNKPWHHLPLMPGYK